MFAETLTETLQNNDLFCHLATTSLDHPSVVRRFKIDDIGLACPQTEFIKLRLACSASVLLRKAAVTLAAMLDRCKEGMRDLFRYRPTHLVLVYFSLQSSSAPEIENGG